MTKKLSEEYDYVLSGILVPKDKLIWDTEDAFGFEYKGTVIGVNRNTEIYWRNRKIDESKT